MQLYWIVSLVAAIVIAVFAIQNGSDVDVKIFFKTIQTTIPILVLISAVAGAVVMFFLGLPKQIRTWREVRKLRAEGKTLRAEQELMRRRMNEMTPKSPDPVEEDKPQTT
jgi:lipopolysaccharide assembly protein A